MLQEKRKAFRAVLWSSLKHETSSADKTAAAAASTLILLAAATLADACSSSSSVVCKQSLPAFIITKNTPPCYALKNDFDGELFKSDEQDFRLESSAIQLQCKVRALVFLLNGAKKFFCAETLVHRRTRHLLHVESFN